MELSKEKNTHFLYQTRALLFYKNVQKYLWREAILTTHLMNRLPFWMLEWRDLRVKWRYFLSFISIPLPQIILHPVLDILVIYDHVSILNKSTHLFNKLKCGTLKTWGSRRTPPYRFLGPAPLAGVGEQQFITFDRYVQKSI